MPDKKTCCFFILILSLLLSACGNNLGISKIVTMAPVPQRNQLPAASEAQQVLRIPAFEVQTLDPALSVDINSDLAIRMMFATLVQLDNNLQVQPYMARSWDVSSDGLQWIFHLQSQMTFSDGTRLTSKDVAYSLNRALQPATKSTFAPTFLALIKDAQALQLGQIKTLIGDSILTPDDETLVLQLNQKAAYFLYTLTMPCASVVEQRLLQKYGEKAFSTSLTEGGTSGPFKLAAHILDKEIDFVPNPYYYGLKPQLQKVIFVTDSTRVSYRDYQDGLVDLTGIPTQSLAADSKRSDEYHNTPLLEVSRISMNFLAKPFDNLYIRQAFALAINREKLNNDLFNGSMIPTYHIIPQGLAPYNLNLTNAAGVKDSRGNADLARHLLQVGLQQEGLPDATHLPPIKFSYVQGNDSIMTEIQHMWQDVLGITVIPDPSDFPTFLTRRNAAIGNPQGMQLWFITWTSYYPDPHDWTTIHFGKGAARNNMNYGQNNSADALQEQIIQDQLSRADAELDVNARISLYQSAEQQLVNQVAWLPLYQWTRPVLLKSYVKGLTFNSLNTFPPAQWSNVYIAAH